MRRMLALIVAAVAMACGEKKVICPEGQVACGDACTELAVDVGNCGACGVACGASDVCRAGACVACSSVCGGALGCQGRVCLSDVMVACFATDEVRQVDALLAPAGAPRTVDDGPVVLAALAGRTWVAHSLAPPSVVGLAADPAAASRRITLGGGDLEGLRADGTRLYVSDVNAQSLVVVETAGAALSVVDEVPLARTAGAFENPHGIAVVGNRAFVALNGSTVQPSFTEGQAIAAVSLVQSCAAPPCGTVKLVPLQNLPGAYDGAGGGYPFPTGAVAVGAKVYVTLANLKLAPPPDYTLPAGSGRLLGIDTAAGDALSVVDLGAGCSGPAAITAVGAKLWIACGKSGAVLPVDASGQTPVVGSPIPTGVVPGGLAICGASGYVTDQFSGDVVRFDPAGARPQSKVTVCPLDPVARFAWASDVSCAP